VSPKKGETIQKSPSVLRGEKDGRSLPRRIGSILFPQLIAGPAFLYWLWGKAGSSEAGTWPRYLWYTAFGVSGMYLGTMLPFWNVARRLLVSRMTLDVEMNSLRIERATFWWPWRRRETIVPVNSVVTGVKTTINRSGMQAFERMIVHNKRGHGVYIMIGKFPDRAIYESIVQGTYVRPVLT